MRRWLYEFGESCRIAYAQIMANKARSFLTALGVIIGILAVTLMGSAINGIDRGFENSLSMIGYDVLYVQKWPWADHSSTWWIYRNRRPIKTEYAEQINRLIHDAPRTELVTAVPQGVKFASVKRGDRQINTVFLMGTTEEYPFVSTVDLKEGRFFNGVEERGARQVCVIGYDIADGLFPNESPIGKTIQIANFQCVVIGVIEKQGKFLGLFSFDSQVIMPLGVLKKYFGSSRDDRVVVKIKDKARLAEAKDELVGIMRRVRALKPEQSDDFAINEQQAFKSVIDPIKNGIALAGLFVTGLALFVGAIGIMNITFVSVKERTREIGTRKALGARRRTILTQFLVEAVAICLVGGVIGLLLAYLLSLAMQAADFPARFSLSLVLGAMLASVATGIVSGFAPAYSASKLDPVEALRYE
ncbi:MAG: ABC transporter permease [Chloroherpetonaceae bacterium]|nr:ABC transporter permease [Chloroherpetonaceae bacterium]MDW8437071.1 ABC transporter permease [Chloroherpetonaceae bacterium]